MRNFFDNQIIIIVLDTISDLIACVIIQASYRRNLNTNTACDARRYYSSCIELQDKVIVRLQRRDRWWDVLEYHSELSGVMDERVLSFGQRESRDPGITISTLPLVKPGISY
jgi:hypothetical protein